MKIDSVLKMDSGSVVCVENNATITITKVEDVKTFTSTYPKDYPPMSESIFKELYGVKSFKPVESASTSSKGKK